MCRIYIEGPIVVFVLYRILIISTRMSNSGSHTPTHNPAISNIIKSPQSTTSQLQIIDDIPSERPFEDPRQPPVTPPSLGSQTAEWSTRRRTAPENLHRELGSLRTIFSLERKRRSAVAPNPHTMSPIKSSKRRISESKKPRKVSGPKKHEALKQRKLLKLLTGIKASKLFSHI